VSISPSPVSARAAVIATQTILLVTWTTVVILRAWVSDDAFITLRTVDNALNGYGLRWNVVERVQAYTHPLWLLTTIAVSWIIGSPYLAVVWISIACSVAAAGLLALRIADSGFGAVFALLLLMSSTAFLDYSTSGLENPLTHLLLAVFVLAWFSRDPSPRTTCLLALLMAGLLLNRVDAGLLVLPAFLAVAWRRPFRANLLATAVGMSPLAAWELFSVVYYGFPFPNTAYAKLGTGISSVQLLFQAGYYFANSLRFDVVTLLAIGGAMGLATRRSNQHLRPLIYGIALYLIYILRIGGDFMAGRFFAAPFFLATIVLARVPWPSTWTVRLAIVAVVVTLRATMLIGPAEASMAHGISDQRLVYQDATRLVTQGRSPVREGPASLRGLELRTRGRQVVQSGVIGMTGYFAGPDVHIVDFFALSDPLLARRPADPRSRIGHFRRRIPAGYIDSIRRRRNLIESPRIARYYDDLVLVTQGPLWTRERWRAIVRLNLFQRTI
jgi:arabinofuranosyltransferase